MANRDIAEEFLKENGVLDHPERWMTTVKEVTGFNPITLQSLENLNDSDTFLNKLGEQLSVSGGTGTPAKPKQGLSREGAPTPVNNVASSPSKTVGSLTKDRIEYGKSESIVDHLEAPAAPLLGTWMISVLILSWLSYTGPESIAMAITLAIACSHIVVIGFLELSKEKLKVHGVTSLLLNAGWLLWALILILDGIGFADTGIFGYGLGGTYSILLLLLMVLASSRDFESMNLQPETSARGFRSPWSIPVSLAILSFIFIEHIGHLDIQISLSLLSNLALLGAISAGFTKRIMTHHVNSRYIPQVLMSGRLYIHLNAISAVLASVMLTGVDFADKVEFTRHFLIPAVAYIISILSVYNLISARGVKDDAPLFRIMACILICLAMTRNLTADYSTSSLLSTIVPILLVFPLFISSYNSGFSRWNIGIDRITNDEPDPSLRTLALNMNVGILGARKSGKSCYIGSLWTMLSNNTTAQLWYGNARYLKEAGLSPPFAMGDIIQLLNGEGSPEEYLIEEFRKHRGYEFTCKELIEEGRLSTSGDSRIPFVAEAEPLFRKELNDYSKRLSNPDSSSRTLLDATETQLPDGISLRIEFTGDITRNRTTFLGQTKSQQLSRIPMRLAISTTDVTGEDFNFTMQNLAQREITSSTVAEVKTNVHKLYSNSPNTQNILNILDVITNSDSLIYLMDGDELTKGKYQSEHEEELSGLLGLVNELSNLPDFKMKSVCCLINKADELIIRESHGEAPTRNMPGGGLANWDEILDQEKARETLNDSSMGRLSRMKIPVHTFFTCTLGGLIDTGEKDANGVNIAVPPYPMVPINVIEPLLHIILNQNMDS